MEENDPASVAKRERDGWDVHEVEGKAHPWAKNLSWQIQGG